MVPGATIIDVGVSRGGGGELTAKLICGSCGAQARPSGKFCSECGAALRQATRSAEYKQVTVLFADVVQSMDITATLDLERAREIITEVLERSAAVVRRYGGTVEYTGDGVMGLFGAPIALEDHAFRACLAALAIQEEIGRVAVDVARRDHVDLRMRVGLNSGQVIAGSMGSESGSSRYAATGEHVGMAQRMESVAPPGAVMLSESTARLVEHAVSLGDAQWVRIKNSDTPVCAYQLAAIGPRQGIVGRAEAAFVGRRWEMAALEAMVDRAVGGRGGVVAVVGPAGIGKSRVARETAAVAAKRGVEVFWVFCESHTRDVPFGVVERLLRAGSGVTDLDGQAACDQLRAAVPADADPQDLLLLDDLLGIADPAVALPQIDPEARRRRLTALVNTTALSRTEPTLFIIEDAHWIDVVSESMLADFLAVIARTPSMVLITARPEYHGVLLRAHGAQTIALDALGDSDTAALIASLLGSDPSVAGLAEVIADNAAGNPFFAEEMVRELAQRGVLSGDRGRYVCSTDVAEVKVPATIQASISARIDRLSSTARQTLHAASVIGARFSSELLAALGIDAVVDELIDAEMIDQVSFTPSAQYALHHPLIRAVAYESQLKSDRADWHRRLAASIEEREPESVEENAALIAEHLQAAGEVHAAYGWHMRAAAWSVNRDVGAARVSWEQARRIADALPADDAAQLSMRIAPRTMLCATDYHGQALQASRRFEELGQLCSLAGDKVSLAIGMTGLGTELLYTGRSREGAQLASEQMALLESIGDADLTVGLAFVAFVNWFDAGRFDEILHWSQVVIDLAAGDESKGANFGFGSPLAFALTWRGTARWWLGRPGWRQDYDDAIVMARNSDPATLAVCVTWTYGHAMPYGVLRVDDASVRVSEAALRAAESSHDIALYLAKYTLAYALLNRDSAADRRRGLELMTRFRDFTRERGPFLVPVAELWIARDRARRGERDAAIAAMREAVEELHHAGRFFYAIVGTAVFVETLLERDAEGDHAEAQRQVDRLTNLRAGYESAMLDTILLRLRALLAR
ncbi:cyclase [Mycolicibacterium agri]|uniref:Cyclase n=1 Tax=Mycolicibacterium agri TaxID=36811 RepID=A0A7I9W877_MYCAG|nr:cyclase [Mycolicibacterium agri]